MPARSIFLLTALLLAGSAGASGNYNGRVHGDFAGRALDVPVLCETPALAGRKGDWFYAQSDPPTHAYPEDRNGDGVAITISYTGERAMFLLYLDGEDHDFGNTRSDQIKSTNTGFVLTMAATRYEGRGRKRRKTSEDRIQLAVDCPRP